jgi:hypothetical protein
MSPVAYNLSAIHSQLPTQRLGGVDNNEKRTRWHAQNFSLIRGACVPLPTFRVSKMPDLDPLQQKHLPAPGGPIKIILTLSADAGAPPPWPVSLFSSSAMRFSSLLTVLLRSSTTLSVNGAIARECEEKCRGKWDGR